MKRNFKRIICAVLIISMAITVLSSCYSYSGDREDLYTVAVNNVFGIRGYTNNGEISYNPEISVIETDDYGRTLFFYNESYSSVTADFSMAFVIMQASDSRYVYYYLDTCYLPFFSPSDEYEWHGTANGDDYIQAVELSQDLIETLKERNDWNRELDESKFTKTKISDNSPEGKANIAEKSIEFKIYQHAKENGYEGSDSAPSCYINFCNTTSTGSELYYVSCTFGDVDENGEYIWEYRRYAVMIVADEVKIVEIKDVTNYYDTVMRLKYPGRYE